MYAEPDESGKVRYWHTATIWRAAENGRVSRLELSSLDILDEVVWFGGPKNRRPTVRNVAEHARDIFNADMSHPVVLTRSGDILDGAHRIARAYLDGQETIEAIILESHPEPDGFVQR